MSSIIFYNKEHYNRSMKSFAAFIAENPKIYKDGKYICIECSGNGKVVADYEQPDPVEGYKHADRVMCPTCVGKKYVSEKIYRDYFKFEKTQYLANRKEEKRINALRNQALTKLTVEEREALGL